MDYKKPIKFKYFIGAVFILLIFTLGSFYTSLNFKSNKLYPAKTTFAEISNVNNSNNNYYAIADAADKVGNAVVKVDIVKEVKVENPFNDFNNDPFFKHFFGNDFPFNIKPEPEKGTGSGFIVNKKGYILTNAHVVEEAKKIEVTLADNRKFQGNVIGKDKITDLAVIKIKSEDLPTAILGDSSKLRAGEPAIAIGNPYGYQHTVTAGIISALGRSLDSPTESGNFIQTDASINPGNSGGPLINIKGEVVGVNTAIIPYAQGIGFAIPINTAKEIMQQLIANGKVERAYLGVVVQEITDELKKYFKLPDKKGVLIADVQRNSPAEKAGLQRGDIIKEIDKKEINKPKELQDEVRKHKKGDTIVLLIYRNGHTLFVTTKLALLK